MADMTDRAIGWVRSQKALMPDKPFFMYFAPGATHAPHHVPKQWADRYRGEFDQGWDKVREETFARQKTLGVIPLECDLTSRPEGIQAWDAMPDQLKPLLAREMEVYAGFLEYADHHVGRLVDAIAALGALGDTLIYYVIGDNGASAEGLFHGTTNEYFLLNNVFDMETPEYLLSKMDTLGGPETYNHYAIGWAHAMDTPYKWTKQVASHWGGTRNATIVHWPARIKAAGEIRSQFCHVIDVAPTVLEACGLPEPTLVNGVQQEPMHGTSMIYSFDDAAAPERHQTQYFEMLCNRGVYHRGWSAVAMHKRPWESAHGAIDDDVWELYDGANDWTQAHDLATQMPDKLRELQRLFIMEAMRFNVLPLDDRSVERFNADIAGRPQIMTGTTQTFFSGMAHLSENSVLSMKNKSYSVTAEIEVPDSGVDGVIIAQGGRFGGWTLYTAGSVLKYCYNLFGMNRYVTAATRQLPAGAHQVRMEFAYDGGGLGKGGAVTLYLDAEQMGAGRVDQTQPFTFSMDETTDIGCELGTPVSDEYAARDNAFTGTINWVRLDIGTDGHDHMIDPSDLMHIAMTRQ
jgi:arylsulfatase A-like enzyme